MSDKDCVSAVTVPDLIREAAEIAGREWTTFSQTKQAHERNSPEPFRFRDFGLDYDKALYSLDCMQRILALESRLSPLATAGDERIEKPRTFAEQEVHDAIDIAECCVHDQIQDPNEREHHYEGLKKVRALALAALRASDSSNPQQVTWADVEKAKADAYEDAARIVERRAEDRRLEHGVADPSTNGWDYPKHKQDVGNALDEEADDCSAAIRKRKAEKCQVTQALPSARGRNDG